MPFASSDFAAAEASRHLQDAVQPQLSERDSIFATHYTGDDSLNTHTHSPSLRQGIADVDREQERPIGGQQPDMAVSLPHRSFVDPMSRLNKDVSPTAMSFTKEDFPRSPVKRPSHRSNLPLQYQRRSLYDLADLGAMAAPQDQTQEKDPNTADATTTTPAPSAPTTPSLSTPKQIQFAEDIDKSAERQQYRSWRTGQAKLDGLTIAQSQRRQSRAEIGVEKVIDAQLPQPEPPVNVRSRKASHYLGLFKENDAASRRPSEKPKHHRIAEDEEQQHDDDALRDLDSMPRSSSKHDGESTGRGKDAASTKPVPQHLPLGLLEEIRNHHHIAPGQARKIPFAKAAPSRDVDRVRSLDRTLKEGEDEESDREHISSATYFPHQGVVLGDSPTDEPESPQKPRLEAGKAGKVEQKKGGEDVQIALRREDTSDCLHGDLSLTREPSAKDLEIQGKHAQARERLLSDSDYESGYSTGEYDSQISEDEELTPTATPTTKSVLAEQKRSIQRKHSHAQPPAPVGAVELKPYRHQVGGHTTVYRFSRRAVCKQLNSKENMFYETVEKHHPELLGFMPR